LSCLWGAGDWVVSSGIYLCARCGESLIIVGIRDVYGNVDVSVLGTSVSLQASGHGTVFTLWLLRWPFCWDRLLMALSAGTYILQN